jgi:hypothetical protein
MENFKKMVFFSVLTISVILKHVKEAISASVENAMQNEESIINIYRLVVIKTYSGYDDSLENKIQKSFEVSVVIRTLFNYNPYAESFSEKFGFVFKKA